MAQSLEQIDKSIQADLDYINEQVGPRFRKLAPNEREAKVNQLRNKLRAVKSMLSTYDIDLQTANERDAQPYIPKYEEKMKEHKRLEEVLKKLKDEAFREQVNPMGTNQSAEEHKTIEELDKNQLMKRGDDLLHRADARLDEATKMLVDAKTLQDDISKELQRIEEQLMKTYETAKDTQSMLKRSKELINYFFRAVQTDKIIMCCLIIVVILVLVVIIMGFAGVKNKNFNSKAVPNQSKA